MTAATAIPAAFLLGTAGGGPAGPTFRQFEGASDIGHTVVAPAVPTRVRLTAQKRAEAVSAVLDLDAPPEDSSARLWFFTASPPEEVRDFFRRRWGASPRSATVANGDAADAYLLDSGDWSIVAIVSRGPDGGARVSVLVM